MPERVRKAACPASLFLVIASAFFAATAVGATGSPEGADQDQGQNLFNRFGCYQCHGHFGQGGAAGPRIALNPYPYEAFATLVRQPASRMPPYTEQVLSDEQLRRIFQYLMSIEKGPSADEIPLLR